MADENTGESGAEPDKDAPGQELPKTDDKQAKLESRLADLMAAQKKQIADYEIMREENQRLQQMLLSMRDHSGIDSNGSLKSSRTGTGRFADPGYRSDFERRYSLPVDAAEEIVDEAVSRISKVQQEREEVLRNGEALKKAFFDEYPDLKDYIPIVKHFSDQCAYDHPNWSVKQGFVEVARNAREYIKSKLGAPSGREEPPEVLPAGSHRSEGGSSARLPGSEEPARVPTQDEEIKAEMDARRKMRGGAL